MKKNNDEPPSEGNAENSDPLRLIGDIGPEYAKALHQIGIHQPADLLRYTPEQLAQELLEKTGKKVNLSRIRSKDWLGQARRIVEAQFAASESEAVPEPAEWQERGMFTIKFLSREDPSGKLVWKILVYDERGPGPEVPFEGLGPASWSQWIIDQMNPRAAPPEERKIAVQPPAAESEIPHLFSPAAQLQNSSMVEFAFDNVDVNRSEESPENHLEVRAGFHLLGDGIDEVTGYRTPYRITFHLIDLENQTSSPIRSLRGRLEPGQETYQVSDNFPLPGPGKYEIHTTLIFEEGTAIFCDGPIFNVVQEAGMDASMNAGENASESQWNDDDVAV